jgi:predicted ABC-type ATPase
VNKALAPRLVLVGGPNGAGKTTFARLYARSEGLPYLGTDDIALQLSPDDPARGRGPRVQPAAGRGATGQRVAGHRIPAGRREPRPQPRQGVGARL